MVTRSILGSPQPLPTSLPHSTPPAQVWLPLRQDIPPAPAQEAPGAEASGGFCHDPSQGSQGHALQDALREPGVLAGEGSPGSWGTWCRHRRGSSGIPEVPQV